MSIINNHVDTPPVVLQPHLGKVREKKTHSDAMGKIVLAKVIRVHHKMGTADVQVIKSNAVFTSSMQNEGSKGARICTTSAHFNGETGTSSGVVEPIQEGQIVLLAFLDGVTDQPIILGSLHNTWMPDTSILTERYPLMLRNTMEDYAEALKYLRVFPSQAYFKVDGVGGVEFSHPSTTFLKIDNNAFQHEEALMKDGREDFDHEDLSEKDSRLGYTSLKGRSEHESIPVSLLLTHRTNPEREETTWTKVYISQEGKLRVTRDNHEDTLSFVELSEDGDITQRVQRDSYTHYEGNEYSQSTIDTLGNIKSVCKSAIGETSVELSPSGDISIRSASGSSIVLSSDGDIILNPARNLVLPPNTRIHGGE